MTHQPSQKGCCNRCRTFALNQNEIFECANPQCECHKEAPTKNWGKVIDHSAPAGDWEDEIRDLAKEYAIAAWAASEEKYAEAGEVTAMDKILASVESLLTRAREEEVSSLSGEDGKLFSRVVAKAFEAPFPAVAVQHAIQRVAEKYKKEGREEGARAARLELKQRLMILHDQVKIGNITITQGTMDILKDLFDDQHGA